MVRKLVSAACLAALLALPAAAQPSPAASPRPAEQAQTAPPSRPQQGATGQEITGRRLPPDVTTVHTLDLPDGRTLRFSATAGALPLVDPQGAVQAELGYVAYTALDTNPATRPVTFFLNGGPGASSAYLHLLVAGPWRLPLGQSSISPSQSPALVPNLETWLDFTDLVFLDPVETGYSRATGSRDEIRDRYFTVDGDVSSIAAAIARWLRTNDRLASPKFFVGESYGGFRGPLVAQKLQKDLGIGLSGVILLSPVLDFGMLGQPRHNPMEFVTRLPSFAAAKLERDGVSDRKALADAERYAGGEYLVDLTRGMQDQDAIARIAARVAELTGLDKDLVRRHAGRIGLGTFQREFQRGDGKIASAYDTGVTTFDPDPTDDRGSGSDGVLTAMQAPLSTAMVDHLSRTLGWRVPNQRYELLNNSVSPNWRYGRGRTSPQVMDELKETLALDPDLRVLVAHGLTDLVTPYFASELLLRQLPAYGGKSRAALTTYPGGHMFYTRDASRAAFRKDAEKLITGRTEKGERG
ncbi:S10 family peptidase [Enterovirga sp. CN4-39]|uniref:S10 family peptidase n=1 Tax=Enterovirga sp. CN4-39 TaxID=3400910 RepID=UPI003BFBB732